MKFTPETISRKYSFVRNEELSEKSRENRTVVDGALMKDKTSILDEMYKKLGFKDYENVANYDGFEELLSPDVWPDNDYLILQFVNSSNFFEQVDEEAVETLFSIFNDVADKWRQDSHSKEFVVVLL